jgi:hypothetical protein
MIFENRAPDVDFIFSSHVSIQGNERADILAKEGSTSGTLFQDQAGLTTVNTSDIQTRASTRLLAEWQERWNDSDLLKKLRNLILLKNISFLFLFFGSISIF